MANPRILNRKLHRWGAIAVALPFLFVICSGLLLQLKKQIPWVQPPEQRGASSASTLTLPQILAASQAVPQAGIASWDDIDRVDVRPGKGILKVIAKSRWELQIDLATGAVVQTAYRRSDLIETLHDGSFFHDNVKLFVFFPVALIVLGLWITGIYLFLLPYQVKRNRANIAKQGINPVRERI